MILKSSLGLEEQPCILDPVPYELLQIFHSSRPPNTNGLLLSLVYCYFSSYCIAFHFLSRLVLFCCTVFHCLFNFFLIFSFWLQVQ